MPPRPRTRARVIAMELTVDKLVGGGFGLAHTDDGRAVMLTGAAAGERVRAEVDVAQTPARGRVLSVVAASADRVAPPCPVYDACGGCDFMHLSIDAQRRAQEAAVREALPASLREIAIMRHRAEDVLGYRTRARLHVRAAKGEIAVGFVGASSHDIVRGATCVVLAPALDATWRALPEWLHGARGEGEARLALGAFPARAPVMDLSWRGELLPSTFAALEKNLGTPLLGGARVLLDGASRPATVGDPTPFMIGADGEPLALAPGGFGQASDRGNALLGKVVRDRVAPLLADVEAPSAVELFAGAGNFTCVLARLGAKVTAVESDGSACEVARRNLATRGLDAKVVNKDADTFPIPRGQRVVLLDPPRTGARGACERIVESKAARVVYVSCDPATLGRDLAALTAGGYDVTSFDLVELFPQTSHVESVVVLTRRKP